MKVFITGGGGFLGSHIVDLLLEDGHEVTSYSRGHYPELEIKGVHTIQGSLEDASKLTKAMADHHVCFHTASRVAMWGKVSDFYKTNVTGTENVIKSCQDNKIPHLIYTSTPSVVFGKESIRGGNEDLPYPTHSLSRYGASKAQAEAKVLGANSKSLKTISLRPHLIFGPGDKNLIPRLVESAKNKKLKIVGNGENLVDVLYVTNAAEAHLLAWKALEERPDIVGGEAYFLGQGPVKLWDFINQILERYQIERIKKTVPFKVAYTTGALIEGGLSLMGSYNTHPPMTRFVAMQLAKDHYFSHDKAARDLNWRPKVSLEEGLRSLS